MQMKHVHAAEQASSKQRAFAIDIQLVTENNNRSLAGRVISHHY